MRVWNPTFLINPLIASGLPVIATVPGHAITLVGRMLVPKPAIVPNTILNTHDLLSAFIHHDDARGPYRLLPVDGPSRKTLEQTDLAPLLSTKWETADAITGILVPLPPDIFHVGETLHAVAAELLDFFLPHFNQAPGATNPLAQEFLESEVKGTMLVRTYVMNSKQFKVQLTDPARIPPLAESVREQYLRLRLPLYVWVMEFAIVNHFLKQGTILGEVIFDSTAAQFENCFLAFHLPGMLVTRDVKTKVYDLQEMHADTAEYLSHNPV